MSKDKHKNIVSKHRISIAEFQRKDEKIDISNVALAGFKAWLKARNKKLNTRTFTEWKKLYETYLSN